MGFWIPSNKIKHCCYFFGASILIVSILSITIFYFHYDQPEHQIQSQIDQSNTWKKRPLVNNGHIYDNKEQFVTKVQEILPNNPNPQINPEFTTNLKMDSNEKIAHQSSYRSYITQKRFVHFDLKGAPPKMSYLIEIIGLIKQAGINGLLIEWEDSFPWSGELKNLSVSKNGYNIEEIFDLIEHVELLGMEIIPLVQTFGHAEFILKGEEYSHLREDDNDPQAFCPSKPNALHLIDEMIKQIVNVHKNSKFIHIGCDEVFNLRTCPICTKRSEDREELFLDHVKNVANIVRNYGKIPIIWDDMLRPMSKSDLEESDIGSLVEIMMWCYAQNVNRYIPNDVWEKFSEIFPTIWVAGSYKGSSGETNQIPTFTTHLANIIQWLDIIRRESAHWKDGIGGIVLTGWSRYDHFAVLCELLPASIPTLIYTSIFISTPNTQSIPMIKNRIFKNDSTSSDTNISHDTSSIKKHRRNNKRSPGMQWIPHPKSLSRSKASEIPSELVKFTPDQGSSVKVFSEELTPQIEQSLKEFVRILHCQPVVLPMGLKMFQNKTNNDFHIATKCSWNGVNFFRTLFHLRSLTSEVESTISSIKYKRGWLTSYNVEHRYSLPLRIDEILKESLPRLKRNLSMQSRSIGNYLKSFYRNDVIAEWIEQNIWSNWKILNQIQIEGDQLKSRKFWERRPLTIPSKMISDLGLHPLQLLSIKQEL